MPIAVWSDFTCHYCYLSHLRLETLRREFDITIQWRSLILRPPGTAPMSAEREFKIAEIQAHAMRLVRMEFGIELNPGPIGIGTRAVHLAAKYAEANGKGDEFHAAALKAYWEEGRAIHENGVLRDIADAIGLDGAELLGSLDKAEFIAAVEADLSKAAEYYVRAVPAFLFNRQFLNVGALTYPELVKIMTRLEEEQRRRDTAA